MELKLFISFCPCDVMWSKMILVPIKAPKFSIVVSLFNIVTLLHFNCLRHFILLNKLLLFWIQSYRNSKAKRLVLNCQSVHDRQRNITTSFGSANFGVIFKRELPILMLGIDLLWVSLNGINMLRSDLTIELKFKKSHF